MWQSYAEFQVWHAPAEKLSRLQQGHPSRKQIHSSARCLVSIIIRVACCVRGRSGLFTRLLYICVCVCVVQEPAHERWWPFFLWALVLSCTPAATLMVRVLRPVHRRTPGTARRAKRGRLGSATKATRTSNRERAKSKQPQAEEVGKTKPEQLWILHSHQPWHQPWHQPCHNKVEAQRGR